LGVIIENNSEEMVLVDDKGNIIDEDMFTTLVSYILFNTNNDTVVVPHSASNIIDKLAKEYGGSVLRTKSSVQDIMNKMVNNIEQRRFSSTFGLSLIQYLVW
jgi:mannose-1-phosphate guanylyltransferase/phosphomannomutase